jgi:hypothetical protein
VPVYTYYDVPAYDYGNGYYLSRGSYTGLDAAIDDIKTGWINGTGDLILRHVDDNTQIAIYLNGEYSYSISGADYANMIRDVAKNIRTAAFTVTGLEKRSDGAYTLLGTHDFYDSDNNHKVVSVSYTLALTGGRWVLVAAGSSESGS